MTDRATWTAADWRAEHERIRAERDEATDEPTRQRIRAELRDVSTKLAQAQAAESRAARGAAPRSESATRTFSSTSATLAKPKAPLRDRGSVVAATTSQGLDFSRPKRQGGILEYVLAPIGFSPMDGWFGLGRVHLIGGSSGAGKTTLIVKALVRQQKGEKVFGHLGMKRRPLVLFADRGELSNKETLLRLRVKEADIPIDYVSDTATGIDAVQEIATLIEKHNVPEVVFVEAADSLIEDGNKPHLVVQFMKGLQRVAEHYHVAIVLSVGAPKSRKGEKHQAQRDRIIGSEKWGRHAEDVLTLEFVTEGNGTEAERVLTVQHRNAMAEHFTLTYAKDGSELIEKRAAAAEPSDVEKWEAWMRQAGDFSVRQFRDEFGRNSEQANDIIAGFVRQKKLRRSRDGRRYRWRVG